MTVHVPDPKTIEAQSLAQLFTEARTHNVFRDKPVSDELLQKAIELAKMGPTSANQSPMRVVFLRSHAAKERLRPALSPGNLDKTMGAPVVAITAYDEQFYEHLPFLFPHADAKAWFAERPRESGSRRLPERHVAGRLSHPRAARGRPRHRTDDRIRQCEGRRRVLPRGTRQVERPDQYRLRRRREAVPAQPEVFLRPDGEDHLIARPPSKLEEMNMAKVLVLYYSSYGHIETMAHAEAEGARAAGATVDVKRVPENVPEEIAKAYHFKLDQPAPIAKVEELANYDAIVVGAPTRFGRMPSAMGSFWEQAGQLWMTGALLGKVGGAFTSSATQHGGNETTLFSIITNLMHFGLIIVGLPYSHAGQGTLEEIVGGAPYGATTIAGAQGQRHPTKIELDGARHQGELIAKAAAKLSA